MTNWNERKPEVTDELSEFPSTVTQNATAFREGISQHFYWTESSSQSAGVPRLSSTTGSARAYFALQSAVSAAKDGQLFVASDTSRLFAVPSAGSVLLGSTRAIHADATAYVGTSTTSFTVIPYGTRTLVQSGQTSGIISSATGSIVFTTPYAATVPNIIVSSTYSDAVASAVRVNVTAISVSGFSFVPTFYNAAPVFGFHWRSSGTVTL